jgi:dolichol-phosphate mannosyltransferase
LVVDDNSPDGTGGLADLLAAAFPHRVAVLHRESKRGLGTAYRAGFSHALTRGYQHIFEMDADFSHDPRALPSLRDALEDADVVLGSRYVQGGQTRNWPIARRLLSQCGSLYAAVILGLPFHDLTGGFKGFSARVLQSLDLDAIRSNGYAFQIEMTYRAYQSGFRIVERPITFVDRRLGHSKMRTAIVGEAIRIVWSLRFGPRPPLLQEVQP